MNHHLVLVLKKKVTKRCADEIAVSLRQLCLLKKEKNMVGFPAKLSRGTDQ